MIIDEAIAELRGRARRLLGEMVGNIVPSECRLLHLASLAADADETQADRLRMEFLRDFLRRDFMEIMRRVGTDNFELAVDHEPFGSYSISCVNRPEVADSFAHVVSLAQVDSGDEWKADWIQRVENHMRWVLDVSHRTAA